MSEPEQKEVKVIGFDKSFQSSKSSKRMKSIKNNNSEEKIATQVDVSPKKDNKTMKTCSTCMKVVIAITFFFVN